MQALLYKTKSRVNDLNKVLEYIRPVDLSITDVINPVKFTALINFEDFSYDCNYCYISELHRYYFVSWEINGNLFYCDLACDVLMSYKDDILSADIIANRSSSRYNKYLSDSFCKNTNLVSTGIGRFKNVFETGENGSHYVIRVGGR